MVVEIHNQEAANDDGAEKHDSEKEGEEKLNESIARTRLAGKSRSHLRTPFVRGNLEK